MRGTLSPYKGEELGPCDGAVGEVSTHRGSDDGRSGLAHAPHCHTQVLRLDNNGNAFWFQVLDERIGDLAGQPLLELRALGEGLDHAGYTLSLHDALPIRKSVV